MVHASNADTVAHLAVYNKELRNIHMVKLENKVALTALGISTVGTSKLLKAPGRNLPVPPSMFKAEDCQYLASENGKEAGVVLTLAWKQFNEKTLAQENNNFADAYGKLKIAVGEFLNRTAKVNNLNEVDLTRIVKKDETLQCALKRSWHDTQLHALDIAFERMQKKYETEINRIYTNQLPQQQKWVALETIFTGGTSTGGVLDWIWLRSDNENLACTSSNKNPTGLVNWIVQLPEYVIEHMKSSRNVRVIQNIDFDRIEPSKQDMAATMLAKLLKEHINKHNHATMAINRVAYKQELPKLIDVVTQACV